jgi:hypothetical protein
MRYMEENEISVGVILRTTPTRWRELEQVMSDSIVYVKRVPASVRLKVSEVKGEMVRQNGESECS